MPKRFLIPIFFIFLIFIVVLLFFFWWKNITLPVNSSNSETKILVVPQGWSVEQIGEELLEQKLIKNIFAFKLMVAKEGVSKNLQAGDFRLSPSMNLYEITQSLTHGTLDIWVTIPEGLREEEVASIIADSFLKQNKDFDLDLFIESAKKKEGYLFPDTYLFPKDSSVEDIINIMTDNFEEKFDSLTLGTSLTENQTIILASLVEREAKYDKDRSVIAGIILKRLKGGWSLDIDATLQYAKANNDCVSNGGIIKDCDWWPVVDGDDKEIKSLYNTYKNLGLPPTAICNPGLASLKAAAAPKDTEYWFYLSDSFGNTYFAKTLEEHEVNIQNYLN